MSSRALTLFGEEAPPESLNVAPKHAMQDGESRTEKPEKAGLPDPLAGWEAQKSYYSVGEVAGLFGIRTSNLRFWTKEFDLKVRTTRKGDRLYTPADIQDLRQIYHLIKERGFTIAGARAARKDQTEISPGTGIVNSARTLDLQNALLSFRNTLVNLRNNLA